MAVAMIGPKFYAWDRNGKPLAFGKLYTYQARTNDPKDTYQSEDQIVPNTNPVILNGEGYANVYLSGSYKMVLKDDKDNEIWSSDPVSASEATEWVNCLTATYLSSTSFKVNGNFTTQYEPGRRVRIDNNASEYEYSTIDSSVFAAGETTVVITDPVITTGLQETCVSIVGPESRVEGNVQNFPDLIAAQNSKFLQEGDSFSLKERISGNGGGAIWDVVDETTVTVNNLNIVAYNYDTSLAFVLRIDSEVYSKQFGVVADGVADDTTSLTALRDYIAANTEKELIFDEGTYLYSVSPNWAIPKLVARALGTVTFRNTGTGNCLIFDDPTGTTFDIIWCWDNPIFIEGDDNTGHGVYNRSVHHSKIAANVRGCGLNCHRVEFAVVNEYNITSSINKGPFYSATAPAGISITERNPGEQASANIWYNPIIEGMRSVGIFVDKALNNKFIGGTSEGNVGNNIECSVDSRNNSFEGIDLEVSGASQSFIDRGRWNKWLGVFCDQNSTIASTAVGATIRDGIHDTIINDGAYTTIDSAHYGANGNELTDTGTFTTIIDAYDIESASIKIPNKIQGRTQFTKTETVGAFGVTPLVPGNITKVGIPLAGVKVGDLISLSSVTQEPNTFTAPTARCNIDGQIDITFSQLNGAAVSPLPAGGDFVISVNGG
tara:strand:- start:337 stop:2322 length:1986 start_codon:yes stop_codon:yes gene_type:complete